MNASKQVTKENEFNQANVFGEGEDNVMFAQYFEGNSYINLLTNPG